MEVVIPNYVRKIKLSDSRKAKYWIKDKVLNGKQILPKKYTKSVFNGATDTSNNPIFKSKDGLNVQLNTDICYWKLHKLNKNKTEWRLTDDTTDEYIIRNTKVAGTENWYVINSQKVTNHTASPYTNGKVVKAIHLEVHAAILALQLSNGGKFPSISEFPIRILMELHDYIQDDITKHNDWDVQNRCDVWSKAFVDCLTELGIIPDDHRAYVTQPPVPLFCPFNHDEIEIKHTPKLVFKIYADRRPGISAMLAPFRKGAKIKRNAKVTKKK